LNFLNAIGVSPEQPDASGGGATTVKEKETVCAPQVEESRLTSTLEPECEKRDSLTCVIRLDLFALLRKSAQIRPSPIPPHLSLIAHLPT
jgi:hypothetical protein